MAKLTPEEYAEKHARRLKGSTEDIRRGVERMTVAPGVAAAKAQEKMKQGIIESIDSGRWAKRVSGVSLTEWQSAIIDKGINRIAAGIDAAHDKQVLMAGKLLAEVENAQNIVKGMPKVTIDDSINRMVAFSRAMHKAKGKIKV